MKEPKFVISSKEFILIIIGLQIATGILSLPRTASVDAHQDAWMAVLLGALVPLISLFLIVRLCSKYQHLNFVTMTQYLFGKYMSFVIIIAFVFYSIFFEGVVVRLFAEISSILLLQRTPLMVIVILIVLAVVYAASLGATVIGRLNVFLFFILLLLFASLIPPAFAKSDITCLLPVGDSGIIPILKSSLATAYSYAGTEGVLVYYFMLDNKTDALKAGMKAVGITTAIYVFVTLIALSIFGCEAIQEITWPVLTLLKIVRLGFIERLEIVFLTFWLILGARPAINLSCAAAYSLVVLFRLDVKRWYYRMVIMIGLGLTGIALIPRDTNQLFVFADYAGYAFLFIALAYPLLYLLISFFRGKEMNTGGQKNAAASAIDNN